MNKCALKKQQKGIRKKKQKERGDYKENNMKNLRKKTQNDKVDRLRTFQLGIRGKG